MTRPYRPYKGGKAPGQKVRKRWSGTTTPRPELQGRKTILERLKESRMSDHWVWGWWCEHRDTITTGEAARRAEMYCKANRRCITCHQLKVTPAMLQEDDTDPSVVAALTGDTDDPRPPDPPTPPPGRSQG